MAVSAFTERTKAQGRWHFQMQQMVAVLSCLFYLMAVNVSWIDIHLHTHTHMHTRTRVRAHTHTLLFPIVCLLVSLLFDRESDTSAQAKKQTKENKQKGRKEKKLNKQNTQCSLHFQSMLICEGSGCLCLLQFFMYWASSVTLSVNHCNG